MDLLLMLRGAHERGPFELSEDDGGLFHDHHGDESLLGLTETEFTEHGSRFRRLDSAPAQSDGGDKWHILALELASYPVEDIRSVVIPPFPRMFLRQLEIIALNLRIQHHRHPVLVRNYIRFSDP